MPRSSPSPAADPAGSMQTYAPTAARIGAVGFAVFAGWWLTSLAVGGDVGALRAAGPWLGLACVGVYAVFWRPAVVVDDAAVVLRNPLRDTRIPWPALREVDTQWSLVLVTGEDDHPSAHRSAHRSWAAAAPGKPTLVGGLLAGRMPGSAAGERPRADLPDPRWTPGEPSASRSSAQLSSDSGAAAFLVTSRWERWRHSDAGRAAVPDLPVAELVEVRWNVVTIAAAAGLAVVGALTALV